MRYQLHLGTAQIKLDQSMSATLGQWWQYMGVRVRLSLLLAYNGHFLVLLIKFRVEVEVDG